MRYIKAFVVILLLIAFSCKEDAKTKKSTSTTTILKGEVIYRPTSDTLLLLKATADARQENQVVKIPIVDGKFNYKFTPDENLAYQLIFKEEHDKGSWQPIIFFPTNGQVNFKLHSIKDFSSNDIHGGALNSMYNEFATTILKPFKDKVRASNEAYKDIPFKDMSSDAFYAIASKLRKASPEEKTVIYKEMKALKAKGLDRSEIGKEADAKYKALAKKYVKDKYDFIAVNPTVVSYYLVIEDLMMGMESKELNKETVFNAFNTLKEKFPDHSYTTLGNNLMNGLNELKPGGQYIDFSAPDSKGNTVALNTVLNNHDIVLLDLWATWCGPCITKTRLVKPVYEKYKDKGFTILGVAGERENLDNYNAFMAKEQWPWQQLIELDKQNKIWEKYNVMNGGGGLFLIAKSGEILAVDPSVEELEALLSKRLTLPNT